MLRRDPDDPRLPADVPGLEAKMAHCFEHFAIHGATGREEDEIFRRARAFPDLLGCVFGLLVNFPELGTGKCDEDGTPAVSMSSLYEWMNEQAPYWRDALEKAGVDLEAK